MSLFFRFLPYEHLQATLHAHVPCVSECIGVLFHVLVDFTDLFPCHTASVSYGARSCVPLHTHVRVHVISISNDRHVNV